MVDIKKKIKDYLKPVTDIMSPTRLQDTIGQVKGAYNKSGIAAAAGTLVNRAPGDIANIFGNAVVPGASTTWQAGIDNAKKFAGAATEGAIPDMLPDIAKASPDQGITPRGGIVTSNNFGDGKSTKYSIGDSSITVQGDSKIRNPLGRDGMNTGTGLDVMFNSSVSQESRNAFMRNPSAPPSRQFAQGTSVNRVPLNQDAPAGPLNTFTDIMREKARQSNLRTNAALRGNEAEISRINAASAKTDQETIGLAEDNSNSTIRQKLMKLQLQSAQDLTNAPAPSAGMSAKEAILGEIQNRKKSKLLPIQ
jgi:hypothetical protein